MSEYVYDIKNKKNSYKKYAYISVTYLSSIFIAYLVFTFGGTKTVFPSFMFIPIVFLSTFHSRNFGALIALFCGILLGPLMPLSTSDMIMQETFNWAVRIVIYVFVAIVVGHYSDKYKNFMNQMIEKEKEIVESRLATIYSLVKLAEMRDDDTGAHIVRVSKFSRLIAEKMKSNEKYKEYLSDTNIDDLAKAAPLHDIGKVGIPDYILSKPGKLSDEEFDIMKKHTTIGASTLNEVRKKFPDNNFIILGAKIALTHHEKWDGTGYPNGLVGEEIPLSGRIMAIADVYDALRSKRAYKPPYSHMETIEIIRNDSGKHFDPEIVEVFLKNEAEFEFIYKYTTYQDFEY
ncbi:MAG: HD domain-containing protein [Acidaminobacter sp.]|uniref:HD-GYP domain-containing protein n=1 Tax=Acidaminobacter sp. TaxID=1872102 RepID=UPI0013803160|nr:HD domain-containing phosphohydrolase [Acidaminobacter sp.]MZQ99522.1 HD domain-containing protein [Acidaminobacter sp.]